ncbi:glycosyltransferase family 2 protein [Mobilicoccus pelagius]|uniref:Putative glycosyltransferase n=1 Tax=Mobilicoccus pelagius NBRC 104925 TaxID=1089455 RepID=H5UNQ6_9MICO|nr:galactosyltransferase-related protein [Mobilicoccus pelagius]GAB47364.1 putative glycosyltransferase [Mobilicoccus pelagius NBRC 104925]
MRIGFYVHHQGAGHLARAVAIARECTEDVVGFSTHPRPEAWPGHWVDLPDDAATPGPGSDPTAGGVLHWAPIGDHPYPARMARLAAGLREEGVDLLLVDVSVEVTLLARLLGVPVVVAAMRGDRSDLPHRLAQDVAHCLVAPWPAALPEPGTPDHVAAKTVHVGGISRFDDRIDDRTAGTDGRDTDAHRDAGSRRVFVLWGRGGGDVPEERWAAAEAATPGWTWVWGAAPEDVWDELRAADVVVAHSGQNAVAEVAAARRPAVVVGLDRPHGEQVATIAALRAGDLAETVDATGGLPDLDWPALLERAARRDPAAWARWTDGHGARRAAAVLEAAARGRRVAAGTAVVTLVHGRGEHLRGLVAGLAAGTHLPQEFVVVAMADPSVREIVEDACAGTGLRPRVVEVDAEPLGLPLARARNLGAARAAELGCDVLVFLDVDCIPAPGLVATYADAVRSRTEEEAPVVWSGPVAYLPPVEETGAVDGRYDLGALPTLADPHPARPAPAPGEVLPADDLRLFWSLSFALTSAHYRALGGFCEEYVGYGGEDTDVAMRLGELGGALLWLGGADAYHQYHPTQRPPVQHLDDIVRNANLFARRWGRHPMEGWLEAFAAQGLARLDGDTWAVTAPEDRP